jgi:hypothetical protein
MSFLNFFKDNQELTSFMFLIKYKKEGAALWTCNSLLTISFSVVLIFVKRVPSQNEDKIQHNPL